MASPVVSGVDCGFFRLEGQPRSESVAHKAPGPSGSWLWLRSYAAMVPADNIDLLLCLHLWRERCLTQLRTENCGQDQALHWNLRSQLQLSATRCCCRPRHSKHHAPNTLPCQQRCPEPEGSSAKLLQRCQWLQLGVGWVHSQCSWCPCSSSTSPVTAIH